MAATGGVKAPLVVLDHRTEGGYRASSYLLARIKERMESDGTPHRVVVFREATKGAPAEVCLAVLDGQHVRLNRDRPSVGHHRIEGDDAMPRLEPLAWLALVPTKPERDVRGRTITVIDSMIARWCTQPYASCTPQDIEDKWRQVNAQMSSWELTAEQQERMDVLEMKVSELIRADLPARMDKLERKVDEMQLMLKRVHDHIFASESVIEAAPAKRARDDDA